SNLLHAAAVDEQEVAVPPHQLSDEPQPAAQRVEPQSQHAVERRLVYLREMPLGEPAADQLAERSETLRRRKLSGEVDPGHLGMDAAEQVPDGAPDRAGGRRGQVDDNGV